MSHLLSTCSWSHQAPLLNGAGEASSLEALGLGPPSGHRFWAFLNNWGSGGRRSLTCSGKPEPIFLPICRLFQWKDYLHLGRLFRVAEWSCLSCSFSLANFWNPGCFFCTKQDCPKQWGLGLRSGDCLHWPCAGRAHPLAIPGVGRCRAAFGGAKLWDHKIISVNEAIKMIFEAFLTCSMSFYLLVN